MRALRRHPIVVSLFLVAVAGGCGGTQSCGCGATPLAHDLAPADKVDDGIQMEISQSGFTYIEQNFSGIVNQFMPGGLNFAIPNQPSDCSRWTTSIQYRICHQGSPCSLSAAIHDVGLATKAPNKLSLSAQVDISGPAIPIQICGYATKTSCDIKVHVSNKPVSAEVIFSRDPVTDALTFDIQNVSVSLQGSDFSLGGGFVCSIGDIGFIKNFIAGQANSAIKGQLNSMVKQQLDAMSCMPCDYFGDGCATGLNPSAGAYCKADASGSKWCMNGSTDPNCIHKPLGFTGNVDLGSALASLMPGVKAPVNMYMGLGQAQDPTADPLVPADGGPLDLRMITGTSVDQQSPCVPDASSAPDTSAPPRIDFATEAQGTPYMVGLGVSDNFLNKTFSDLYRSGGLCLDIGSKTSSFLSTGLFTTFLPSLNSLTEGKNAPMIIALRPKDWPTVDIGKGTYHTDPSGKIVLDDPLLTIHMKGVHLDFYAQVDQRYVRLFTLTMDIDLPLGLDFTGNNQVIPILGDLSSLISNVQASNSEILAEDPSNLAQLIPALIGLIQPALAGALKPIALPAIQGFALNVNKIAGIVPMTPATTPPTFAHLGIFAGLALSPPPATGSVQTTAQVASVQVPATASLAWAGPVPNPSVVLDVGTFDASRTANGDEWQYRIDGGFWSPFQRVQQLTIASPLFLLQGHHRIDVRGREIGHYQTLDQTPASVTVDIDWTAPTGRLSVDPSTGAVQVFGHDLVTPAAKLEYAFSVDGGPFTGFSTDATTTLPVDAQSLVAEVRDEAGNTTRLTWQGPKWGANDAPVPPAAQGAGCAVGGRGTTGGILGLLVLGLGLALVRRRR